jgi:hypothetical protein
VDLRAGQRFETPASTGSWQVTASPDQDLTDAPDARTPALPDPTPDGSLALLDGSQNGSPSESGASAPGSPARTGTTALDWSEALQRGDFQSIVADAKRRNVDRCLASCSARDLRALGDAARYTGELALAERVLLALRGRSATESVRASYLLGSLEEARGNPAAALKWYTECVRAAPSSSFAPEARAGRLRMLGATGNKGAAREAAEEYLRLHPNAVGAATARRILDSR